MVAKCTSLTFSKAARTFVVCSSTGSRVTNAAHAHYRATSHFSSLDGLRCLSILPVVWHHSTPRPLPGLLGKGPAGVDLFFCISGFLITTLLLREKARSGSIQLLDFYVRRALRILPLYYATLLSYLVFASFLPADSPQRAHFFRTLPLYATFTANWFGNFGVSHAILFSFAWSLCIEEQFYAFWPWFVQKLSGPSALAAMLAILTIDLLTERGTLSWLIAPGGQAFRIVTSFATPIGLGAILALLLDDERSFSWVARALAATWSAPIAVAAVCTLLCWPSASLLAFQLALMALVGACVIREQNGLSFLLEARAPSYIGRVSYGIYLLNLTAIGSVRRLFPAQATSASFVFALSFPLALALAALSQRYLEAPFLRLRARFRGSRAALPVLPV
jgi:peptidoglycan/LPS O-acetylase OafA/YrhL